MDQTGSVEQHSLLITIIITLTHAKYEIISETELSCLIIVLLSCRSHVVVKMAPRMAAVLRAPGKLCSFSYVLFVFLLFYVLDVVSSNCLR